MRLNSTRATTIVVWALVIPFAIWALVRLFGLERGLRATQIVAFTPYAAILAVAPFGVSLIMRRWRAAAVAALSLLVLVVAVLPRALPGQAAAVERGTGLVVMTLNLNKGQADPERVVELVRENEVDLAAFQELSDRSLRRLDAHGLGRRLRHRILPSGQESQASILSGLRFEARLLPTGGLETLVARPKLEQGSTAEVWAVHPPSPTNDEKLAEWEGALADFPELSTSDEPPRLLVGDFNATLDHAELRRVLDAGYVDAADATGAGLKTTFSSSSLFRPPLTIDHVLVDPRVEVLETEVHEVEGSDHKAVIAKLRIPRES